jgi:hypothetical protein
MYIKKNNKWVCIDFLHHEVQEGSLQPHPLTIISANVCSTKQDGSKMKNKKLPYETVLCNLHFWLTNKHMWHIQLKIKKQTIKIFIYFLKASYIITNKTSEVNLYTYV